ncbi:hypothetical protein [Pseudomonas baetica]|uniref:hypothetical protein n=1 Tax=Pseudomonas baetica TaxID=674054 RepID=UPI002872A0A9|nr:hypothetical protein [Pseudomonas baetica]MDR9864573.1 hypothetical protein [Pseudomonas baetica]
MDIQSAVLNQLFALFPVIIQGWITPVRPAGIAHGGIPQVLYDGQLQGLLCLIDPWPELQLQSWTMAVDDRVDLYINDDPTPVTGVTIKPGEEALRQRLYIPHGYLKQGVNRLHYKVIRVGGNTSEDSRDLLVLYHLRTPDNLDLVIPPDVIKDGVSAERAAQGVEFRFFYNNRRPYDRIRLLIGDTEVTFDVADGNAPITHTLFTDAFRAAGDNSSAVIQFFVFDQLGNPSKSPEKRLDIHLEAETFDSPILRERLDDPGDDQTKIDLEKLAGDPLLVIVQTSDLRMSLGDLIYVTYICKVTGQPDVVVTPPAGTVEADEFGQRKPCVVEVPNEHVIPDGAVTVTYKVHRANDEAVGSSRVAIATVTEAAPIELIEDFQMMPFMNAYRVGMDIITYSTRCRFQILESPNFCNIHVSTRAPSETIVKNTLSFTTDHIKSKCGILFENTHSTIKIKAAKKSYSSSLDRPCQLKFYTNAEIFLGEITIPSNDKITEYEFSAKDIKNIKFDLGDTSGYAGIEFHRLILI